MKHFNEFIVESSSPMRAKNFREAVQQAVAKAIKKKIADFEYETVEGLKEKWTYTLKNDKFGFVWVTKDKKVTYSKPSDTTKDHEELPLKVKA